VIQDLRHALRLMLKSRSLTLVAMLTLALGIGANTAIFTVINALLLRPLPYADPDRLVMVWVDLRAKGGPATEWTGPANHFDWKAQTDVFDGVTTLRGWNASLSGDALPESFLGEQTTYEYFDVLGVPPELGRGFRPSDDIPNAPRVVVLSHGLWMDRFGGDRNVIGRMVSINGERHEIIGVMPASFMSGLATNARLWRPMRLNPANPARSLAVFHTIGRLKRGVSLPQARASLDLLAKRLEREHPETDTGKGINPVPLQEQKVGNAKPALFMLLGAVGFVLLIACVNIANLLLARASGRLREIAVRRALGADRMRIVRQLLTESIVLSVFGGAAGVLLGVWGVSALKAIAPDGTPRIDEVSIDRTVLLFAAALSLATGIIFGLVPAWHAARDQFSGALKQGGRGQAGESGRRARRALVVAEIALALVLLVGGGLLIRTFLALQHADLGFTSEHVLTGFILPPPFVYKTGEQRRAFYDAVLERTAALPGVKQAALSSVIPLNGDSDTNFEIEGRPAARSNADALAVWYRDVSANYFDLMGIPLRRGRLFRAGEMTPQVVINETMAKRHWPNEDPVGRRLRFEDNGPWFTICGIVGDVRVRGPRSPHEVEAYIPYWLMPEAGTNVVLKTATEPLSLVEPLKRAVKDIDPGIAVASVATMDSIIADSIGGSRFYATLVAIFAGLALVLAAVGIYGVMSYGVAQRTQEIGVRLALGAANRQVFALIIGDSLRLAFAGLVIGAIAAAIVGRSLQKLLFGVQSVDPVTFAGMSVVLLAVAFLASYLPARRAMRTNPMEALRIE
jgi:putative ABC transport system permease protein